MSTFLRKMTEKQLQSAARELCRLKGVNPDQMMAYAPDPEKPDQIAHLKSWEMAAKLIEAQEQLEIALTHGRMSEP